MTDLTDAVVQDHHDAEYSSLRLLPPENLTDESVDEQIQRETKARELLAGERDRPGGGAELYDTQAVGAELENIRRSESGGATLPNRMLKPYTTEVAGHDLATGEKLRPVSSHPLVERGVMALRNTSTNTIDGPPVDALEGLADIAAGLQADGLSSAEFRELVPDTYPDDYLAVAWQAGQRALERQALQEAIDTYEPGSGVFGEADDVELAEVASMTDAELQASTDWLSAARTVYEAFEGEPFTGTDAELHQDALDRMSYFNYNAPLMARDVARVMRGSQALKESFYNLMNLYDAKQGNWSDFGRALGSMGVDPTTYATLGLGRVGMKAGQLAIKQGLKRSLAGYVSGAVTGAGLGAGYGAAFQTGREVVGAESGATEGVDAERIAQAAGVGAGAGAVLNPTLQKAIDVAAPYAVRAIRRGLRRGAVDIKTVTAQAGGAASAATAMTGGVLAHYNMVAAHTFLDSDVPPFQAHTTGSAAAYSRQVAQFIQARAHPSVIELKLYSPESSEAAARMLGSDIKIELARAGADDMGDYLATQGQAGGVSLDKWALRSVGRVTGRLVPPDPLLAAEQHQGFKQHYAANKALVEQYYGPAPRVRELTPTLMDEIASVMASNWVREGEPRGAGPLMTLARQMNQRLLPCDEPKNKQHEAFIKQTLQDTAQRLRKDGFEGMTSRSVRRILSNVEQRIWDRLGATQV